MRTSPISVSNGWSRQGRIGFVLLLASCGFAGLSAQETVPSGEVFVGVSETSITPGRPVALEGAFALRISTKVETPIVATVIFLETRQKEKVVEQSVMVSADLVHIPMEMVEAVRRKVAALLPSVDTSRIFISTTHTHQAPVVMRDNFILPAGVMTVAEYIDFFVQKVSQAILTAHQSLQRGSVAWGLGHAQVAYNRRSTYLGGGAQVYSPVDKADFKGLEGPEYQGIPALFFFDAKGEPLAVAVNAWSPSQEHFGSTLILADYWHHVRERLKKKLGEKLVVLAWCGAAGDQGPWRRFHNDAEDRMRRLRGVRSWLDEFGRRISDCVLETYELVRNDRHEVIKHAHRNRTLALPGWVLSKKELSSVRAHRDALAAELEKDPARAPRLARQISWRTQLLQRQESFARREDKAYDSEVHVVRLGDIAICTNQFELYTEYGIRILGRSPAHLTFVVQLVGPAHYLPTSEAVAGGGYGAIPESCAVGPEGGTALVDGTLKELDELFNNLVVTLPGPARLVDGEPQGSGWENLLAKEDSWDWEPEFWSLNKGQLRGEYSGGGLHHFALTRARYSDFELHAVFRLTGTGANSGIGIRLQPENHHRVPGYQVDMGSGYWGSLWEEGGGGMLQKFPERDSRRLVISEGWNHYYIVAEKQHLQAWLNGVKTIDFVHKGGRPEGNIGVELCNGPKHTIIELKTLSVRRTEK